jgi:CheY-like chemotaxis protein
MGVSQEPFSPDGILQTKEIHPDLMLMDVQMPGISRLEVTQEFRGEPIFEKTHCRVDRPGNAQQSGTSTASAPFLAI